MEAQPKFKHLFKHQNKNKSRKSKANAAWQFQWPINGKQWKYMHTCMKNNLIKETNYWLPTEFCLPSTSVSAMGFSDQPTSNAESIWVCIIGPEIIPLFQV